MTLRARAARSSVSVAPSYHNFSTDRGDDRADDEANDHADGEAYYSPDSARVQHPVASV